jgi:hypothetical protein
MCEIDLVLDLASEIERMPEPDWAPIAGHSIPLLRLPITDPDLPLRVSAALAAVRRRV